MSLRTQENSSKDTSHRRPHVLLIDDSIDSVKLMTQILDQYKCSVTMAYDGEDSIPLFTKHAFDLLILDWQMPFMDGRDTLVMVDRLLSDNKFSLQKKSIPVLIYTSHDEAEIDLPACKNFKVMGILRKGEYSRLLRSFDSFVRAI